jgi:hypothetical protein
MMVPEPQVAAKKMQAQQLAVQMMVPEPQVVAKKMLG